MILFILTVYVQTRIIVETETRESNRQINQFKFDIVHFDRIGTNPDVLSRENHSSVEMSTFTLRGKRTSTRVTDRHDPYSECVKSHEMSP